MIPNVASITNINFGLTSGMSMSVCTCLPSFTSSFNESRKFKWNVETAVQNALSCSYFVGEGPLYWYRIDWYPSVSICHTPSCASLSPIINFLSPPNCPYDIVESCIILPPTCSCSVSCIPGTCISQTVEVWHMLATSVPHLCERINQECCHRRPPGYMRRVRQYMRPALCCDVAKIGAVDQYVDVSFLACECGNLIDPCIATVIYPCSINYCGIHGSVSSTTTPSSIKMTLDLLGHLPIPIEVTAEPEKVEMIAPKTPKLNFVNKYGNSIPELIKCGHNLADVNILKDFLKSNKLRFDSLDLYYNKSLNSWYGMKILKDWKIVIELVPLQNSYKLSLSFDKGKNLKSKISLVVKETFGDTIDCRFNPTTGVLKRGVLQSSAVKDDIGLFKNFDLHLIMKG